jgi:hypothetical protein
MAVPKTSDPCRSLDIREVHLDRVLDASTVTHFQKKTILPYAESLKAFFDSTRSCLSKKAMFRHQGGDLWVRYTKFLLLQALYAREQSSDVVGEDCASSANEEERSMGSLVAFVSVRRKNAYPPVPSTGMVTMLHLHRTAHIKYVRCLEFLGIPRVTWSWSEAAASETAARWMNAFNEPYVNDIEGVRDSGSTRDCSKEGSAGSVRKRVVLLSMDSMHTHHGGRE